MQYIDCNINPISRVVSYPGATIVQRDTNVEALRFHFSLDAEYELENDSIRIMVLKDGKTNGFNAENVRVETNDGGDEELVFEHTITTHETATPGQIAISVCGNQVSGNNITEAWHTLNMVFQVSSAAHSESDEGEDTPETIASNAEKIAALQTLVNAITSGRPIPVDLKSKMTDTSAIYLYTGTETGEQHNYWYYHDGTSWVPGSEYGGMTIDDELSSTSENAVQNKVIKANFDEINGRLQQVEGLTGVSVEGQISATTEGRAINPATGGTNANAALAYYTIPCNGGETLTVTMPIFTSSRNLGIAFYTSIDGSYASAYISGTKAKYNTSLFEMSYETKTLQVPDNARVIRTTWFATGSTHADAFSCVLEKPGTFPTEFKQIQSDLVTVSENRLDPSTILVGKYINVSGSQGTSDAYAVTDYIKVKEGETLYARFGTNSALPLRYVAAYDSGKAVLSAKGTENASSYTVPEGVVYVRISANANYLPSPTTRISTSPECEKYQPYLSAKVADFSAKAMTCAKNTLMYPLSTLPPYILGALAYRPLGVLSQGYVCFVSDDGRKELATYSIPMFISKGVPLTMAVMSDSEVFTDAENASTYTATVVDAVQNHGFEIAQHGGTRWDEYSEYGLNRFFENESAFFANLGLTAYGAACPAHNINDLVRVVAGGRFGCVRTGYDNGVPRYTNYMSGPKSNIFGLSSQSAVDGTLSTQCAALDMAKENHWLRVIHYHEFDLDTSAKMEQLEGIIDYAKEIGLTFITMKDIPTII